MICPAGVFINKRVNRFAERISPTTNGEILNTVPNVGSVGNATPPPTPPKKTPAIRLPIIVGTGYSALSDEPLI
jgi:hypothetical protein